MRCDEATRARQTLNMQLEEARNWASEEERAKSTAVLQLKNLRADLETLRSQLDEEASTKADLTRRLASVGAEAKEWKAKFEAIGVGRTEELEEAKRRLSAKLVEAEDQVEQALSKVASLEKTKQRLMCDMDDLSVDVEKAQASANAMDKRQRQFDRQIGQWKEKCESAARELTTSQMEARAFSAEVFKLKAELQEQVAYSKPLFFSF